MDFLYILGDSTLTVKFVLVILVQVILNSEYTIEANASSVANKV